MNDYINNIIKYRPIKVWLLEFDATKIAIQNYYAQHYFNNQEYEYWKTHRNDTTMLQYVSERAGLFSYVNEERKHFYKDQNVNTSFLQGHEWKDYDTFEFSVKDVYNLIASRGGDKLSASYKNRTYKHGDYFAECYSLGYLSYSDLVAFDGDINQKIDIPIAPTRPRRPEPGASEEEWEEYYEALEEYEEAMEEYSEQVDVYTTWLQSYQGAMINNYITYDTYLGTLRDYLKDINSKAPQY